MSALGITAPHTFGNNDDVLGEVPKKVQSLTFCFTGLLQEEIVKIFYNFFKPINFYYLYHICSHHYKSLYNQEWIGIEDGMLRLRKTSGTYKNFG